MLDKDKKSTDIKPTATLKDSNQGTTDKKKDLPVNEPLKKESTPVKPSTQLRRASAAKGHQNGVVLSPVKTGGKENDGNLDNTVIQIPITKESLSVLIESKKDGYSPREQHEPTKIMKLKAEIEDCHKHMTELKNTNSSLQSQLTEAKRKKENLRVQISALEQADKQQKEKEQENLALVARKHQEEMEAVKIAYEKKLEEKRLKRQAVKKKLIKKEGQLQDAKKKLTEVTDEVDTMVSKAKSDTQLASLVREALEAKLQALTDSKEKECTALLEEIEMLKRNYFLSLGLALKLSKSLMGEHSNQDLDGLYSLAVRDRVPHQEWAKWLALKMLRD